MRTLAPSEKRTIRIAAAVLEPTFCSFARKSFGRSLAINAPNMLGCSTRSNICGPNCARTKAA